MYLIEKSDERPFSAMRVHHLYLKANFFEVANISFRWFYFFKIFKNIGASI